MTSESHAHGNDKPRILLVDDEPNLLAGLRRHLAASFDVTVADSGATALGLMATALAYDVIVSDMRMPNMNGAQFLQAARLAAPDTVRILLTGQADTPSSVAAVNDGGIFRFLTKPCAQGDLQAAVHAGVQHSRLVRSERQVLEETLTGSVKLLADVLALVAPEAFARSRRLQNIARKVASSVLPPGNLWMMDCAALLSQVGAIAIKAPGRVPHPADHAVIHEDIAASLIGSIPRLRVVADMVRLQRCALKEVEGHSVEEVGGAVLCLALELDDIAFVPGAIARTADLIRVRLLRHHAPRLVDAAMALWASSQTVKSVPTIDLREFMVLEEDLTTNDGTLILSKGAELSPLLLERIRRFGANRSLKKQVLVRTPDLAVHLA